MKTSIALVLLSATGIAAADEVGRVLSSTPIVQQVAVPHQVCGTQQIVTQAPKSGAGAVMGALAGGAMGNAIGGGSGRAVATALGLFGGAVLGDRIEGGGATQVQNVPQCGTQTRYENHTVGYHVVYEYAGKQYSAQLPNDPGPTLALQVSPVGAMPPPPAPAEPQATYDGSNYTPYVEQATPVYAPPVYGAPAVAYPGYDARPYGAPAGMSLNFGYSQDRRGRWR